MYSIKLGFEDAIKRLQALENNEHYSEGLVTAVFTVEKTFRRTLRQLIISTGFKSKIANKIINKIRGIGAIKENWEFYDPEHRKLTEIIPSTDWQNIADNVTRRNNLVHGIRTYKPAVCKEETGKLIQTLKKIKKVLDDEYGYSGWNSISIRKTSVLHQDPKVKIKKIRS